MSSPDILSTFQLSPLPVELSLHRRQNFSTDFGIAPVTVRNPSSATLVHPSSSSPLSGLPFPTASETRPSQIPFPAASSSEVCVQQQVTLTPAPPLHVLATPAASCLNRRSSLGNVPDSANLTPEEAKPERRLSWADNSGKFLCRELKFFKDDEPWRCSRTNATPLLKFSRLDSTSGLLGGAPSSSANGPRTSSTPCLEFTDLLPSSQQELISALGDHGVQLESVMLRSPLAFCTIRVSNICFHKKVFVRVTSDNWKTHTDIPASYLQGSSDGLSDRFYATLGMPSYSVCHTLQFAICFETGEKAFWDNNNGLNYTIRLLPPPSQPKSQPCLAPLPPYSS